ncbi:MAG: DinB family protein [Cyclobacteriaceae bacterium]|jgi:uncharacterized damage-inducible protein DinB|nr:DinB family protein [Flammeovirgaceae bacterium]
MSEIKRLLCDYATYNEWANTKWIDFARQQSDARLYQSVTSSFPSLIGTLHHILVAQEFWYSIIARKIPTTYRGENDSFEKVEVLQALAENSQKLKEKVFELSDEEIQSKLGTPWRSEPIPLIDVIQHCINHNTYHRGQCATICRQLGYTDLFNVDYYEFLKVRSTKS